MSKSRKIIITFLIVVLSFALFLGGCTIQMQNDVNSIVSIEKTATNGLIDTYTITYSNGETSEFTVVNGASGQNGQDLTVETLYQEWLKNNEGKSYEDFLKAVLSINTTGSDYVVNKALCSSLKVYSEFTMTYSYTTNQSMKYIDMGAGSAVIYKIDDDYTYFITNYHVVYNSKQNKNSKIASKITCYLYGSESVPKETETRDDEGYIIYDYGTNAIDCEYVGGTAAADIAVLKTNTTKLLEINPNVKEVEFASDYHVGETAIAIGNPDDDGISVTQGVVSMDNEFITLTVDSISRKYRSIRIDTPLYAGNSGGGLFNANGKLIGITNAGAVTEQNVNYAVPLHIVKPVVENIMYYKNGFVNKITVGVTVQEGDSLYDYDETTGYGKVVGDINVVEVGNDSIASEIKLQVGDVITTFIINGKIKVLARYFNIGDLLYTVKVGDVIAFGVMREGSYITSKYYTVKQSDIAKAE
ncbi:MAG: serine protease [Clostridia bacterium]|nr:serine protease [Clostridia bacterium]